METEYIYGPSDEERPLRDYWNMFVKRRRLIFLALVVMLGLGGFITSKTTPLYTAGVTLKLDPQPPTFTNVGDNSNKAGGPDDYQTQVALLKSRALAARVIKNLRLESNPSFRASPSPIDQVRSWGIGLMQSFFTQISALLPDLSGTAPVQEKESPPAREFELGVHPGLISRYLSFLNVKPMFNTQLVQILFSTVDPHLSQDLANAHAEAFIRMSLETRFELTKEAREFLEKKLAELKGKVERSEEAINRFRQTHGVVSIAGNENIVVDRMVDLNKRLTEARAKRIELESLSRIVKDKNFEYLSQIIDNNLILQLKVRIEGLEAEQSRLATIFTPDHPRLVELGQQISQARRRLNLEINNVVRGIESDYAAARAREAALQAEAERQQQAALNLKELGVEYTLLQGELDANRAVYDNVLKRLNETSVSNDSPISNIQITEPAEIPLGPSSPDFARNLTLAAAFGLFFGVGLAILLEHFDSTVRTPNDVWRAVAIPTLGVVPHLKALRRRKYGYGHLPMHSPLRRLTQGWAADGRSFSSALMVSHHPLSILAESFRTIRTVLLLGQVERPPQVILLTSAHAADGKTSTTLNLAITLAQSGRNVIVVDADLRKGNCHSLLGLQNRRGLSHVLTDSLPLEESVQRTGVAGLSLLPRGAVPPNPADLLGSNKMREVLVLLRQHFDFVLIDSPPAIAISDAATLSVLCDGVLLVLRGQTTTTEAARRVTERLEAVGAKFLGAVLVGIDLRNPDYADYRNYYKSYYTAAQKAAEKQV
jgi:capsular exopolysaccharide synthesis family protein